jgi:hypothetical protein
MKRLYNLFRFFFFLREVNVGFSRGALGAQVRNVDSHNPLSWEFSAFSQNGEDGIIDYLVTHLRNSNKQFIEIGTSNGLANNTAYLALVKKFCGIMVEGNSQLSRQTSFIYNFFNKGVVAYNAFVTVDNIADLIAKSQTKSPDVFVLDIDGNDYYLADAILSNGFRPSIFVVEYNSNFGPEMAVTIPYVSDFDYSKAHRTRLYYGASISAWRYLFTEFGYEFISVESCGVNAIFIAPEAFTSDLLLNLNGVAFIDNNIECQLFNLNWEERYRLIADMPLKKVNSLDGEIYTDALQD